MRCFALTLSVVLLLHTVLLLQAAQQVEVSHIHETAGGHVTETIAAASTSKALAAVHELISELKSEGAQIEVDVRDSPGAGLGMFAQHNMKQGDIILSVPTDAGVSALSQHGVVGFLLDFVLDFYNPDSPRALFYATMPEPHELRHQLNFPQQYLPLLQHKDLEELIGVGMPTDLQQFCKVHEDVLTRASITCDNVAHALGLLGTRSFKRATEDQESFIYNLLPVLDMANHNNACPNYNVFGPCQFDPERECVFLTAGGDITAGQEVCYWYGHLLPDRAFLEYGFLPEAPAAGGAAQRKKAKKRAAQSTSTASPSQPSTEPAATAAPGSLMADAAAEAGDPKPNKRPRKAKAAEAQLPALPLFGIDRHDYDPDLPLAKMEDEPPAFAGDVNAMSARIEELQKLHDTLKAGDTLAEEVAAKGPAPEDADGFLLRKVLQWRLERQRAVAAEVERLNKLKTAHAIRLALSGRAQQQTASTSKKARSQRR